MHKGLTKTFRISTLLALLLDLRVHRQTIRLGVYNNMQDIKTAPRSTENFHDAHDGAAGLEIPEFSHGREKPYKLQQTIEVDHFGYSAPSEQTTYDGAGGVHLHDGYSNGGMH